MIAFPNAKINIGLFITAKRSDGYHHLETIFYPVDKHDALEIVPSQNAKTSMSISGLKIEGEAKNNLVWKAYELLQNDYPDKISPIDIFLHKAIPMGGGMGGGSADAACMLKLMNDFFDLKIGQDKLLAYALLLGSDCPFFIINKPCYATGRGEMLQAISLDLAAYQIKIVNSNIHISTANAFKLLTPKPATFDLKKINTIPLSAWRNIIVNDFEESVFNIYPELKKIKDDLYESGALYASMSGSGSSVYGIFKK